MDEKTIARFWEKVEKTEGCWLWRSWIGPCGYGEVSINRKTCKAHRVSWFLAHGSHPTDGSSVCHSCDVRHCVNPAHLFLGTHKENIRDMARKLRAGHRKLTREQAIEAIDRCGRGETHRAVGFSYGVTRESIRDLVRGKHWQWLHEEITAASRREK